MALDKTPYKCSYCGKWCAGYIAYSKHFAACLGKIIKRCERCEYAYIDKYSGVPESCGFGLKEGAAAIGVSCPKKNVKTRRNII